MDGSLWQRWLGALLMLLVIISAGWMVMRWVNSLQHESLLLSEVPSLQTDYRAIRDQPDSVGGSWLRTLSSNMKDVQGDLIWNSTLQKGMMRFINLPAPKRNQLYRLWLHDSRAVDGQPILGAELELGSGKQELFATITPQKTVMEPFKFVLTMGQTGHAQPNSQIMLMVQP